MTFLLSAIAVFAISQAGGTPTPPPQPSALKSLEGSSWNAVELYGTAVPAAASESGRGPYLEFGTDGRLTGSDGCNRVMSSYVVKGNAITFGPIAGTRMACPGTEEIVNRFHAALKGTGHWRVRDGRLEFFGATGKPLAVFAPRPAGAR
jgi:copper homeostasis protein (lipoprotein)/putative lipoprotein